VILLALQLGESRVLSKQQIFRDFSKLPLLKTILELFACKCSDGRGSPSLLVKFEPATGD
jgi:hypothetical protein